MRRVVGGFLEEAGFQIVGGGDLPLKSVGVRSGIVKYGKNTLIHADGFGSYLRLAAVVTDAELDCVDGPVQASDCGDCSACVEACPTNALTQPFHLARDRCICWWLRGNPIPREDRHKVGNLIRGCDFCQAACPMNQGLVPRKTLPFELKPISDSPELIPLLLGDEKHHKNTLPEITLEAGSDTIRRNVAIALGNSGDRAAVPALGEALGCAHQPTRLAAAWALGQLGGAEARQALTRALERDQDDEVKEEIRAALGEMGDR
jgi:epoxyqueuosine reductase